MLKNTTILGVKITTSSEEEILKYLNEQLNKGSQTVIFTPNPEQLSAASGNSRLKGLLNQADVALPDGVGVLIASKLLGKGVEARITGTDFMKTLVKSVSKRPVVAGFFGGQNGIAEQAAERLKKFAPNLAIGYASDAYSKEKMIESDIDILFVGLGFPKQEEWIMERKDEIPAKIIMAVGGAFDFYSGRVNRAPSFIRAVGLEWLFRLAIQPWRFFRQLRLLHFGALIFFQALSNRLKT